MKTKKMLGIVLCLLALAGLLTASLAVAADPVTLTGQVTVDDKGAVLAADDGQSYVLDGDGLDQFNGKKATVTGVVEEKDGQKVLVVDKIEEAK
ncbi:MAG: DUF5818 domain-containing protein [Thermodesulfobacteriota bacterium]